MNALLGYQLMPHVKIGLGYNPNHKRESSKTHFVFSSKQVRTNVKCHYCCTHGHIVSNCVIKRKGISCFSLVWVSKANAQGLELDWVPKT